MRNGFAAFRIVPYISRNNTNLRYLARDLDKANRSESEPEDGTSENNGSSDGEDSSSSI